MSPAAKSKTKAKKTAQPRMPKDAGIVIDAEPVKPLTVRLVGETYKITPPKSSLAIKLAVQAKTVAKQEPEKVLEVMDEWIDQAFGPRAAEKVRARFEDPKDLLDITHVMGLMEKVIEASTGDPTS
jgi:hypothetical protein